MNCATLREMGIRTYEGAVVLITGGASGIGAAVGAELVRRGAEVVLADNQEALNRETASRIGGIAETLDVRDRSAVEAVVARTFERKGRLDYVFNNAGLGVLGEAHLLEPRDWDLVIDVNIGGMFNVVRAAYPRLVAQGFGHLVNTASMAGLITTPLATLYSATKHTVVGLSKGLRIEAARKGVRVSALCPGAVRTPILTGGAHGRILYALDKERMLEWWKRLFPVDVEPFAKDVVDCVAKNEGIIILPKRNRAFHAMLRVTGIEDALAKKAYDDTLKFFPEIAER